MSTTHLERTKDVIRDPKVFTSATIKKISSVSPTVKFLQVLVQNKEFSFKSGQWVDFIVPGLSTVGGFSMCSSPSLLKKENMLDLAVKYSTHPPAYWVHNECVVGSKVFLQVGGNFSYEMTSTNLHDNLLLIAAGVGINPLLSTMKHVYEVHQEQNGPSSFGQTVLLYTATSEDELIFKEDLSKMEEIDPSICTKYFVTRQYPESLSQNISSRRINEEDLKDAINHMRVPPSDVISYLCAPSNMMSEMEAILLKIGLRKENVRYESWW